MTWLRVVRVVVGGVLAVALVGCAADKPEVADVTIMEAKAMTQAVELEVARRVPAELVASIDQSPTGSLLSCEGERNYNWAGGITVYLTEGADLDAAIQGFTDANADGWTIERETSAAGNPRFAIRSPDGVFILADAYADHPVSLEASSFSPCFHLPDDESPLGRF
ncbi:hypothetical protein [Microbacterium sp.]|uniref:hypothetical protein n=1 Tax=Microbacterium sp. TaxID=51671 RepID=UPI0039E2342E